MDYEAILKDQLAKLCSKFEAGLQTFLTLEKLVELKDISDLTDDPAITSQRRTMGNYRFTVVLYPDAADLDEERLRLAYAAEIGHMIYRFFCFKRDLDIREGDPEPVISEMYDNAGVVYCGKHYASDLISVNVDIGSLWISLKLDGKQDEFAQQLDRDFSETGAKAMIYQAQAVDALDGVERFGRPVHQLAAFTFYEYLAKRLDWDYDSILSGFNQALRDTSIPLDDLQVFADRIFEKAKNS